MLKRKLDQQLEGITRKQRNSLIEFTNSERNANECQEIYQKAKDSNVSAFAINYNDTSENTTTRIENCVMEQLALLDVRAALHAKKADFTSAMQDSEKMIQIAPRRAAGYIRAAELLSMYGYYKRAIEIYERGWKEVENADERQIIKTQSDNTKELQRKKDIDVVGRLPYDILAKIIRYVSVTDVKTAINVSQAWENQLAGIPHIWSTTRIANAMDFKGPRELTYVSRVSHHIVHLEISYVPAFVAERLFQQIVNGNFTKLARLTLHGSKIKSVDTLMMALAQVKNTLKNLSIKVDVAEYETHPVIPLGAVLSTCVNLKRLHCNHPSRPTFSDWIVPNASFTSQLTDISLPHIDFVDTPTMTELLRMCPRLRYLRLTGSDIAPCIITSICPEVELLCMDFGNFYIPPEDAAKENQGPTGIRRFGYFIEPSTVDHCAQILNSNCHTLKELNVAFTGNPDEMGSLEAIEPMRKLRSLVIFCRDIDYIMAMVALLKKAPGLTDLQFDEQCSIQSEIFEAVLNLRRLKRLSFSCPDDESVNPIEAPQFFRSIARRGIPLKSLSFSACEFVDDDVLDALADITTLQYLELFMIPNVTEDGIRRLFTSLKNFPCIERIELVNVSAVTDATIRLLHNVKTLTELHLNDLENVTSSSVQGFDKKVDVVYWASS